MKRIIIYTLLTIAAGGLTGRAVAQTGPREASAQTASKSGAAAQTASNAGAPREIHIQTPGLMYDPVRFQMQPGETVKITLENIDEMSHNLVITQPGAREKVIVLAFLLLKEKDQRDFVPDTSLVLAHIPLLHPGEKKSILFEAPGEEGVYPYVCTFPGHGTVMYGAIHVTRGEMPPLEEDTHIPPQHGNSAHDHASVSRLPVMYRTFMPECGPAGIAVGMEGNVSYCWDAGQCRLRYAWKGGFISLEKNWASNGSKRAELIGEVFYREGPAFPLRLGDKEHIPKADFQGYNMEDGYPTFSYRLDDVEVTERITPSEGTAGFKRVLHFSGLKEDLWFFKGDVQGLEVEDGRGEWEGNYYRVTPVDGKTTFTLIVNDDNES